MTAHTARRLAPIVLVVAVLLGPGCALDRDVAWTPAGADLVFMSNRDGNAEIYVIRAGSSEWTNLTRSGASENWPRWSPDGSRIAYQSDAHGRLDIWVMDADGSHPTRLTDDDAHDYIPSWSPDGTQITFASWRTAPGDDEPAVHTYVMNADGSGQRRLLAESPGASAGVEWSPDGRGFLLDRKTGDQGSDVFVVDADGAVVTRLTDDASWNGTPVYSPDAQRIAFYADHGEASDIVVMDADGSNRRTLVAGGRHWYPGWSPDGRWIVFTSSAADDDRDLDILAVEVDGDGEPIVLVDGPGREAEGRWRPHR